MNFRDLKEQGKQLQIMILNCRTLMQEIMNMNSNQMNSIKCNSNYYSMKKIKLRECCLKNKRVLKASKKMKVIRDNLT